MYTHTHISIFTTQRLSISRAPCMYVSVRWCAKCAYACMCHIHISSIYPTYTSLPPRVCLYVGLYVCTWACTDTQHMCKCAVMCGQTAQASVESWYVYVYKMRDNIYKQYNISPHKNWADIYMFARWDIICINNTMSARTKTGLTCICCIGRRDVYVCK